LRRAWIRLRLRPDRRDWLLRPGPAHIPCHVRAALLPVVTAGVRLADRAVSA